MMKNSYMQKKEEVVRNWYVIDAEGISLGRVAAKVANVLRGKHKPTYTPNIDCGDYVIVVNASKVNLTGDKLNKKVYYDHSGYTGGLRERTAREMIENYDDNLHSGFEEATYLLLFRMEIQMRSRTYRSRSMQVKMSVSSEKQVPAKQL